MALADQGPFERENLADQAAGLVAVVDDHGADAGVDGQNLDAEVRVFRARPWPPARRVPALAGGQAGGDALQ